MNHLDPTVGAVLPLVGVILGALAAAGTTYWLRRRDERRELRAVARLLVADLNSAADYLLYLIEAKQWARLPDDLAANVSRETWSQQRLLVARSLVSDADWRAVAAAFEVGPIAGFLIAGCAEHAHKERYGRDLVARLRAGADPLMAIAFRERKYQPIIRLRRSVAISPPAG